MAVASRCYYRPMCRPLTPGRMDIGCAVLYTAPCLLAEPAPKRNYTGLKMTVWIQTENLDPCRKTAKSEIHNVTTLHRIFYGTLSIQ